MNRFLFCTFFLISIVHSQSDEQSGKFMKGFFVNVSNDTIHGYIKDEDRLKISRSMIFLRSVGM